MELDKEPANKEYEGFKFAPSITAPGKDEEEKYNRVISSLENRQPNLITMLTNSVRRVFTPKPVENERHSLDHLSNSTRKLLLMCGSIGTGLLAFIAGGSIVKFLTASKFDESNPPGPYKVVQRAEPETPAPVVLEKSNEVARIDNELPATAYEASVSNALGYERYSKIAQDIPQKDKLLDQAKDLYETLYSMNLLNFGVATSPVGETGRLAKQSQKIVESMQKPFPNGCNLTEQEADSIWDTLAQMTIMRIIQQNPDKIKSQPQTLQSGGNDIILTPQR